MECGGHCEDAIDEVLDVSSGDGGRWKRLSISKRDGCRVNRHVIYG
jgi:hypothetical protein